MRNRFKKEGQPPISVEWVENRAKYTAALMIAIVAVGALLILPYALAEDEPNAPKYPRWHRRLPLLRLRLLRYVLGHGVPTEIECKAMVLEGNILVVEIAGDLVNVNIPGKWVVDGETLTARELFDGEPFGFNSGLFVSTLKLEKSTDTHTVNLFFAYAIEDDGATAHALLPFNIETS